MAHLITDHDPYHIHKVLGLLVLLHYLHRYYVIFAYGTAFPAWSISSSGSAPPLLDAFAILLHGALSWSSLLLPLPQRRNFDRPMIWPEFRFHSILFASRHVVCTMLSLCDLWPNRTTNFDCIARIVVVIGTSTIARSITSKYGDRRRRTTNSMPYPTNIVDERRISSIRALYATSQFGATITCLSSDPTINFSPLLGIQMAPLLMTLVRKNKIGCQTYHACYAASLFLGYAVVYVRMLSYVRCDGYYGADDATSTTTTASMDETWDGIYLTARSLILFGLPFTRMRRDWGVPAPAFWMGTVPFGTIVLPRMWDALVDGGGRYRRYDAYAIRDILAMIVRASMTLTLTRQAITYAPLFGMGTSSGTRAKTTANDEGRDDDARVDGTSSTTDGGKMKIDDRDHDEDGDGDTESSSCSSLSD
jgi:hypothetical protein